MRLENVVWDSPHPRTLGLFWAEALGARVLDDPRPGTDGLEARLELGHGVFLDLCFPPASTPPDVPQRLHLDLRGGDRQSEVVERLLDLGARRVDIGQGDVPWVVLDDPDGNAFCVMEDRAAYRAGGGPLAALPLDVSAAVSPECFLPACMPGSLSLSFSSPILSAAALPTPPQ